MPVIYTLLVEIAIYLSKDFVELWIPEATRYFSSLFIRSLHHSDYDCTGIMQ